LISRRLLMLNLRRLTWVIRDSRRLDIRRSWNHLRKMNWVIASGSGSASSSHIIIERWGTSHYWPRVILDLFIRIGALSFVTHRICFNPFLLILLNLFCRFIFFLGERVTSWRLLSGFETLQNNASLELAIFFTFLPFLLHCPKHR
jgi:hypothetical protein